MGILLAGDSSLLILAHELRALPVTPRGEHLRGELGVDGTCHCAGLGDVKRGIVR